MKRPFQAPLRPSQPGPPRREPGPEHPETGKYTPLWMLLAAVLFLLVGFYLLLSRPVGRWVASVQPTPTLTSTAVPTVTPTATLPATAVPPTPTPGARAAIAPRPAQLVGPAQALYRIQMIDEQRGWGHGNRSLWRTQDGGNSWVEVTPPEFNADLPGISTFFLSANEAWSLAVHEPAADLPATLYHTNDAGRTWLSSAVPFGAAGLFFLNAQEGWAFVQDAQSLTSATRLYATQDGGDTWKSVHQVAGDYNESAGKLPRQSWLSTPVFLNLKQGWIGGVNRTYVTDVLLYTTQNSGETWQLIDLGLRQKYPGKSFFVFSPVFSASEPTQGVLPVLMQADGSAEVTSQWVFFSTRDGGKRWEATRPVSMDQNLAIFSAPTPQDLFVFNGATFSVSQDGGQTWQRTPSSLLQVQRASGNRAGVSAMQFVNRRTGWAWGNDGSRFYLYRSHDGGKNWFEIRPVRVSEIAASCDVQMVSLGREIQTVAEPGNYTGWSIYQPGGYSFSFYYPPGWRLLEAYRMCPDRAPTMNSIMLLSPNEQGAYLVVGFRRVEEPAVITFALPQAGEWARKNDASFWGETVSRDVLMVDAEERAVYYSAGQEIVAPLSAGTEMVFTLTLSGRGEPGEEKALLPEIQTQADQIIQSFHIPQATSALLESMDVSGFISISPNGQWQAETLTALPIPDSSPVDQKLQRVTVYSGNDSRPPWIVLEQWLPAGAGEAVPSGFTWSPDNDSLYFYENVYPDGCPAFPYHQKLRRARLDSQQLEEISIPAPETMPNLAISPDTQRMAYLMQAASTGPPTLWIRNLETGLETAVPYTFPAAEGTWSSGSIFWSPDGRRLVFLVADATCNYQEQRRQVLLVNVELLTARSLTTLAEDLRVVRWQPDGSLLLEDRAGSRLRMDVDSGERSPFPPDPLEKPRSTLERFLNPLANAPGEPGIYESVVELYGGDWDELIRLNMGANPQDRAAMLRLACERSGRHCLRLRRIVSEEALSDTQFRFVVELMNRDGSVFALEGQTQFPFIVERDEDGRYRVMQLPP